MRVNAQDHGTLVWCVTLDGVKVEMAVAADDEAGTVTRLAPSGAIQDPDTQRWEWPTEELHGTVVIVLMPNVTPEQIR